MAWKSLGEACAAVVTSSALMIALPAAAQAQDRAAGSAASKTLDTLGLQKLAQKAADNLGKAVSPVPAVEKDPREGELAHEQAKKLMRAVEAVLANTAENRAEARKLPSKDSFIIPPIWTETKESREAKINDLLDSALGIVTDLPIVDVQKRIEASRRNIRDIEDLIVTLKEKKLTAPKDGVLPGFLSDTVDSLDKKIEDQKKRIEENRAEIGKAKGEIQVALDKSGIKMGPEQLDLLLDSVLSGDLVRLVAAFTAAKTIDVQLGQLVTANKDNLNAARKYFAMHAALFAMLVHGQDMLIQKIDAAYIPKLAAIDKDIKAAAEQSKELLRNSANRPDQKKALEANVNSQKTAQQAASYYRQYLLKQRDQLAIARARAAHDLKIADNTYQTVEASFQLRALMKDAAASFEAIQKLESPGFDQIFQNEELRREFENLTRKLGAPTS